MGQIRDVCLEITSGEDTLEFYTTESIEPTGSQRLQMVIAQNVPHNIATKSQVSCVWVLAEITSGDSKK